VPVLRPVMTETTALGAAYLAGLATGFWPGPDGLRANWREDKRFEPRGTPEARDRIYGRWKDAVGRAKAWDPAGGRGDD